VLVLIVTPESDAAANKSPGGHGFEWRLPEILIFLSIRLHRARSMYLRWSSPHQIFGEDSRTVEPALGPHRTKAECLLPQASSFC
jgi:hypothetical protein